MCLAKAQYEAVTPGAFVDKIDSCNLVVLGVYHDSTLISKLTVLAIRTPEPFTVSGLSNKVGIATDDIRKQEFAKDLFLVKFSSGLPNPYDEPFLDHCAKLHFPFDVLPIDEIQCFDNYLEQILVSDAGGNRIDVLGNKTTIAIIDSGFYAESPMPNIVISAKAHLKDFYDIALGDDVIEVDAHGSGCAYIASRVAPKANYVLLSLPQKPLGQSHNLARAIIYGVSFISPARYANNCVGADVIMCALTYAHKYGKCSQPIVLESIVYSATHGRDGLGTLIVWSVPNDHAVHQREIATCPYVLAVGAADQNGNLYRVKKGWGQHLDMLAPGQTICASTDIYGERTSFSGSSAAAPQVAGAAALLISKEPTLRAIEVQAILRLGCSPGKGLKKGHPRHKDYGYGILNAKGLLDLLQQWQDRNEEARQQVARMVRCIECERRAWHEGRRWDECDDCKDSNFASNRDD